MTDALRSVVPPAAQTPPGPDASLGSRAMSVEDYARVVEARSEFVDFLLAPARGQLAAAA
jgi:hypothetical protein